MITGHLKDDDRELDWEALSRLGGTLVFLMGMANLQEIAEKLIAYGRDGKTPAAVIQWATTSRQKVVTGTLREIYEQARQKKMTSPSLIVVGDVVKLREKLNFFDKRPLKGKNIVVTRAREQSSSLVEQMEALGGCAIEIPAISIEPIEPNPPLSEAIQQIHRYTYILFTSVNGVRIFFASLFASGADARALSGIRIVTVGRSTADALRQYGICADLIPKKYSGDDLVELMKDQATAKDCILIPRAEQGSPQLVQALERLCPVTEIPVYRTIQDKSGKDQLIQRLRDQDIDYITFTSSSTVQNLMDMIGEEKKLLERVKLISIGPITSKTLEEGGLPVYKQAEQATIEGLIACIEKDVQEE